MNDDTVQALVAKLLIELGVGIKSGSITLHLNESRLQQVETKTFRKFQGAKAA